MSDTTRGAIYGLTAASIWGGLYVVADVVLETIPPFTLLTVRLLLGILVLAFFLRHQPHLQVPSGWALWQALGVGMIGFGISIGAQFVGTDYSTAVNGSLITSAAPAFILIFAALILHEKLTQRRIAAVMLATLGVVVIIDPTKADFSSETFQGDVALAIAAFTWGLYSVLVRQISARLDTMIVTILGFFGGLILTVPAAALELSHTNIGDITPGIILGVLYLGTISTAGSMWLWNRAFALVDASVASLFFFAQPFVGAGLSVLLLGQAFTINLVIGGALIMLGVLFSIYAPQPVRKGKISAVGKS